MQEFQKSPKKWAKISRKLVKRNEHQAKNRFIWLMTKELSCNASEIRELIRKNCILGAISLVLESRTKNINEKKNKELEYNIDQFINF